MDCPCCAGKLHRIGEGVVGQHHDELQLLGGRRSRHRDRRLAPRCRGPRSLPSALVAIASVNDDGSPIGRRVVLGLMGLGAAGIVTGRAVQDRLAKAIAPIQNADPTGLVSLLPLGATFRYYSVTGSVPSKNETNYRLDVGGLVNKPTSYTLTDLQKMPQTTLVRPS